MEWANINPKLKGSFSPSKRKVLNWRRKMRSLPIWRMKLISSKLKTESICNRFEHSKLKFSTRKVWMRKVPRIIMPIIRAEVKIWELARWCRSKYRSRTKTSTNLELKNLYTKMCPMNSLCLLSQRGSSRKETVELIIIHSAMKNLNIEWKRANLWRRNKTA